MPTHNIFIAIAGDVNDGSMTDCFAHTSEAACIAWCDQHKGNTAIIPATVGVANSRHAIEKVKDGFKAIPTEHIIAITGMIKRHP